MYYFCADYEEEKLLGSILVPSYKISVCGPEDRVHRKHSFKAEHINMRTYFFAADSTSVMAEWIKALTLASLLQEMPRYWNQGQILGPVKGLRGSF